MNTWRLAWKEWYRSNRSGQPNRDFLSLTVLLFLTLTLALLLWGGREGLLNKFVDVSVGNIEGAGIPIWLAANYTNLHGIDRNLLQALRQQNITLYPYREVEYHEVDLPKQDGPQIWASITDEKVPFNGWAVSFQDPLWQMGMKTPPDSTLPLDIILNRSLFEQNFNCSAYIKALQKKQVPITQSDNLGCLANGILWLDVKVGRHKELHPFRIHWQPHIPTMENLAFLFPLSTLNTLKMAKRENALTYYPEQAHQNDCANQNNRVKELIIWGLSDELMSKLSACLQNAERKHTRLTLKKPLPKSWVAECAKQNGLSIKGKEDRPSPPFIQITEELPQKYCFQYDVEDYLTISCQGNCQPCQAISTDRIGEGIECSETKAKIDMIAMTGSYQKAFAYVENRFVLSSQVEKLKNFRTKQGKQAFYIPSIYDDALVRFRFIDQIMGILQWASSPFFIIFLIILLLVQVGIVINHRKHNYGILLSKGVSRWQVRGIVIMQITLSFAVAMVCAVLVDEGMQWLLAGMLENVATMKPYIDHIIVGQLDLLPLSVKDYFWVGTAMLVVLYIITEISLRVMILKQEREPAYLFD